MCICLLMWLSAYLHAWSYVHLSIYVATCIYSCLVVCFFVCMSGYLCLRLLCLRINPSKTEFIIVGLPAQIKKIPDPSIHLSSSTTFTSDAPVRNLGVTFDPHLSFFNHISSLFRSCFMHIRDLRCIQPMLDFKTASTIATSIVHSKLDYCNFLFLNLDSSQIHRLQLIQNSLARAVTRTPRYHHINPVLKSLHWLKVPECIHLKVLSLTYNSLQSSKPTYLRELFTIQPTRSPRSSSCLPLSRTPVTSHLMFSNQATSITTPRLWNDLPPELRTISSPPPPSLQITRHHLHLPPLSVTPRTFHSKLKSHLFNLSYLDPSDHSPSPSQQHPP